MIFFNGRLSHDHGIGEFARDDTTGRSVVDYAIGSPVIFNQVDFLKVLPWNLQYKSHQIPKLKCFLYPLAVDFAQSIEARC